MTELTASRSPSPRVWRFDARRLVHRPGHDAAVGGTGEQELLVRADLGDGARLQQDDAVGVVHPQR